MGRCLFRKRTLNLRFWHYGLRISQKQFLEVLKYLGFLRHEGTTQVVHGLIFRQHGAIVQLIQLLVYYIPPT